MFRRLGSLVFWLVVQAIGTLLGLLACWQALGIGVNYGLVACLLLCGGGLLTFFALIAIHELGHLSVGLAMGFPFMRFTVGPLQLVRDGARIRPRLNTAWFKPAAYVIHELPQDGVQRWRWAAVVFAGPLSNLLVGAACLAAAHWLNPGPPVEMPQAARAGWRSVALLYPGDPATAWLNIAGLVSLGLGIAALVPSSGAGLRSDGGQLLDLWQGSDEKATGSHAFAARTARGGPAEPKTVRESMAPGGSGDL